MFAITVTHSLTQHREASLSLRSSSLSRVDGNPCPVYFAGWYEAYEIAWSLKTMMCHGNNVTLLTCSRKSPIKGTREVGFPLGREQTWSWTDLGSNPGSSVYRLRDFGRITGPSDIHLQCHCCSFCETGDSNTYFTGLLWELKWIYKEPSLAFFTEVGI